MTAPEHSDRRIFQNVGRLSTLPSNGIKARPVLWLIGFRTRPPSITLFVVLRPARLILLGFLISISLPVSLRGAGKPNIILVTLDSTRADRMGFLGSHSALTPDLDGLARESIIFEHAYAQAPLTVVSDATILSGTYPQTHGTTELGSPLSAGIPWLPEVLHSRGYQTGAFVGSTLLGPKSGFAPGF